ncbi:MAG: hypothetical protein D8M59_17085 [Planctomycetes bacterium]|nr:hypothetical protein [Planctomycetota bacterium]
MFAQTVILDDKFELEFKKVVKNSRLFEIHTSSIVTTSKDCKKIQFRFKLKSLTNNKEDFDPNKFYMISDTYKKRIRLVDAKYTYQGVVNEFKILVNNELTEKERRKYLYSYDPTVKDTFHEYQREGYEDINTILNFGTKRNPDNKEIYFNHRDLRTSTIDIYFAVPLELTEGDIYYGTVKLVDFQVE